MLTLEVGSFIFAYLTLLKDVKTQKDSDDKLKSIKNILEYQNDFMYMLRDVKDIHDQFETLRSLLEQNRPLVDQSVRQGSVPRTIETAIENFIAIEYREIKKRKLSVTLTVNEVSNTPFPIRDDVAMIQNFYPELAGALHDYDHVMKLLRELKERRNFGGELDTCIRDLRYRIDCATTRADNVILHAVPILAFMHYEITNALA